jgi:hypothetical protein
VGVGQHLDRATLGRWPPGRTARAQFGTSTQPALLSDLAATRRKSVFAYADADAPTVDGDLPSMASEGRPASEGKRFQALPVPGRSAFQRRTQTGLEGEPRGAGLFQRIIPVVVGRRVGFFQASPCPPIAPRVSSKVASGKTSGRTRASFQQGRRWMSDVAYLR